MSRSADSELAPNGARNPRRRAVAVIDGDNVKADATEMLPAIGRQLMSKGSISSENQLKTIVFMSQFLMADGIGVRARPTGVWYSERERHNLRLAGCVIAACSAEKEETDRQIIAYLQDFVLFGDPKHDVIVIVSSDQDYYEMIRVLRRCGFQVWIVTDSRFHSDQYVRSTKVASPGCCVALHDILKPCPECLGIWHGRYTCTDEVGSTHPAGSLCPLCFKVISHGRGDRVAVLCAHAAEEHGGDGMKANTYDIFCSDFCLKCFRHVGPRPHVCLPPEKKRPCPICSADAGNYDSLREHIILHHQSKNTGRDLLKILSAATQARYLRPEIMIPRCELCLQNTFTGRHTCPVQWTEHVCPVCDEELSSFEGLVAHCDDEHRLGSDVTRIVENLRAQFYMFPKLRGGCSSCLEAAHYGKCKHTTEPHACRKCSEVCDNRDGLIDHMRTHPKTDSDVEEELEEQAPLIVPDNYRARFFPKEKIIKETLAERRKRQEAARIAQIEQEEANRAKQMQDEQRQRALGISYVPDKRSVPVAAAPAPVAKPPVNGASREVCIDCFVDLKHHQNRCLGFGDEGLITVPCVICAQMLDPTDMDMHMSVHAGNRPGLISYSLCREYLTKQGFTLVNTR